MADATAPAPAAPAAPPPLPFRVGHGYDLHRLEAGRPLILGGVTLPHPVGCAGHSDGDAVYHCVVDGILGALGEPDIGQLFPDTDPRFQGAASDVFMRAAAQVCADRGYAVGNVDVTVLLERPKVSPVKAAMRANIAGCLGVPEAAVNVKAKTGEKVDAVGENRAVAVHAVVLLTAVGGAGGTGADAGAAGAAVPAAAAGGVGRALSSVAAVMGALAPPPSAAPAAPSPSPPQSPPAAASLAGGAPPGGAPPPADASVLDALAATIASRRGAPAGTSWTATLLARGVPAVAQKVGEEATEVVIEAVRGHRAGVVAESADLLYHLLVCWEAAGVDPAEVWAALAAREGVSGVAEKASRGA